jgi:hypothetical protein
LSDVLVFSAEKTAKENTVYRKKKAQRKENCENAIGEMPSKRQKVASGDSKGQENSGPRAFGDSLSTYVYNL